MSALGQSRHRVTSVSTLTADIHKRGLHVNLVPKRTLKCSLRTLSDLGACIAQEVALCSKK